MSLTLKAENAVLRMELLFDINAAPREVSIPPEIHIEEFTRLKISVNAPSQNGQAPALLISSDTAKTYYVLSVRNNVALESSHLTGTIEHVRFNLPKEGYLILSRDSLCVPEISSVFCPINTHVTIDLASNACGIRGIVIIGKRNLVTSLPYSSPSLLQGLAPVIKPGITKVEVSLPEYMTILHKYQFSVMAVDIDGCSIYSRYYIELLPGGKLVQGAFSLI